MNIKRVILFVTYWAISQWLQAQTNVFFNNGAIVGITDDIDVYVGFDLSNGTPNSFLSNAGRLTVKGDLVNNGELTGGSFTNQPIGKDTGVFNLYGNWENNNQFIADESTVKFLGNTQFIKGTSITSFYNLETQQTPNSVKALQNIDAKVTHLFTLKNGVEFATNNHTLHITSTNAGAIAYDDNSFVSSTGAGRLTRATSSTNDYYFPLGSSATGVATIRPIIIKPSGNSSSVFAAKFVHNDPTNDGYDVNKKAANIDVVNNRYYHFIKQTSGAAQPADLSMLYKIAADGNFSGIGRWQGLPQWEDLYAESSQSSSPFDLVKKIGWLSSDNEVHALITQRNIKEYEFPSVFTPNGDNKNDRFGMVEGSVATLLSMKIYNRWGQLVFDKEKENSDFWDGKFLGKEQPVGTYMLYAKIRLLNGDIKNEVRPFTILH
jgi:gliding motility-associated-like protein